MLEVAWKTGSLEILKLESGCVLVPDIAAAAETDHVLRQVDQFLVSRVVEVGNYWNAIIELEPEREDWIINQDHISKTAIADDSEIFYKNAFISFEAVLTIESKVYQCALRVN